MPDEDPQEDDLPHLGADQLEDEQDLAEVVDEAIAAFCKTDTALNDANQSIELVEQAIRELLGDSSGLIDHLGALLDAQAIEVGVKLVRWGFEAGRRAGTGETP